MITVCVTDNHCGVWLIITADVMDDHCLWLTIIVGVVGDYCGCGWWSLWVWLMITVGVWLIITVCG